MKISINDFTQDWLNQRRVRILKSNSDDAAFGNLFHRQTSSYHSGGLIDVRASSDLGQNPFRRHGLNHLFGQIQAVKNLPFLYS